MESVISKENEEFENKYDCVDTDETPDCPECDSENVFCVGEVPVGMGYHPEMGEGVEMDIGFECQSCGNKFTSSDVDGE